MLPESRSWQLTRKCRCLFTAGKKSINFAHTSSISYDGAELLYAKKACICIYMDMFTQIYIYICTHCGYCIYLDIMAQSGQLSWNK